MSNLPEFLQELTVKIGKCARETDSNALLYWLAKTNDNFKQLDTNFYKYKDYFIGAKFKFYGVPFVQILTKLNEAGINIVPEFCEVAQKENTMYIITRIVGTETGDLIPFYEGCHLLSDEAKQSAYNDVKKLLEINLDIVGWSDDCDDYILAWFITPENPKIVVMNPNRVRVVGKYEDIQRGREYSGSNQSQSH